MPNTYSIKEPQHAMIQVGSIWCAVQEIVVLHDIYVRMQTKVLDTTVVYKTKLYKSIRSVCMETESRLGQNNQDGRLKEF